MKKYINDYTRLNLHSLEKEAALYAKGRNLLFKFETCNLGRVYLVDEISNEKYLHNGLWQKGDDFYRIYFTGLGDEVGIIAKKNNVPKTDN